MRGMRLISLREISPLRTFDEPTRVTPSAQVESFVV